MGCCDPTDTINHDTVRDGYGKIAETGTLAAATSPEAETSGGCCGPGVKSCISPEDLAAKVGYSPDQIANLPDGANMGLSCGNPLVIAGLTEGQTVVDLGSGGGFDVFLAGPKVGQTGRVIGVDMTPAMLTKARANTAHYTQTTGLDNVEFRLGEIEHLPLADASVDVVISNCVINLSPNKPQVWREIARVLKPGGYVAASDMALFKPLPEAVATMPAAQVGCVGGAVLVDEYQAMIEATGMEHVTLTPKAGYVEALVDSGDPLYAQIAKLLPEGTPADYVTSVDVVAMKSGACDPDSGCC